METAYEQLNTKPELRSIMEKDPSFVERSFLDGANWAFGTIVEEFAKGNLSEIKPYLANKVHETFKKALKAREKLGEEQKITVIAVKESEILQTAVEKNLALVTVRFVSDQDIFHPKISSANDRVGYSNNILNFWQ